MASHNPPPLKNLSSVDIAASQIFATSLEVTHFIIRSFRSTLTLDHANKIMLDAVLIKFLYTACQMTNKTMDDLIFLLPDIDKNRTVLLAKHLKFCSC